MWQGTPQSRSEKARTLPRTTKSQEIFHLQGLCHISIKVEVHRTQSTLTQCHDCQQFGHVWANCKQPQLVCGAGGATYARSVQRRRTLHPLQHVATANCCRKKPPISPVIRAAGTRGRSCRWVNSREHPNLQQVGCSLQTVLHRCPLRGYTPR
jgi:hypothetical protein